MQKAVFQSNFILTCYTKSVWVIEVSFIHLKSLKDVAEYETVPVDETDIYVEVSFYTSGWTEF